LPFPLDDYPHIGSSIEISLQDGSTSIIGTLGGYIIVDGQAMGLTNHHVAVGASRLDAFPTADEESSGISYAAINLKSEI
jgi:hypothetical protein